MSHVFGMQWMYREAGSGTAKKQGRLGEIILAIIYHKDFQKNLKKVKVFLQIIEQIDNI